VRVAALLEVVVFLVVVVFPCGWWEREAGAEMKSPAEAGLVNSSYR
jgi:hypothetical protein